MKTMATGIRRIRATDITETEMIEIDPMTKICHVVPTLIIYAKLNIMNYYVR